MTTEYAEDVSKTAEFVQGQHNVLLAIQASFLTKQKLFARVLLPRQWYQHANKANTSMGQLVQHVSQGALFAPTGLHVHFVKTILYGIQIP